MSPTIFTFVLLIILAQCQALVHMYLKAGHRTCFYKDLSQQSVLLGRFRMEIQEVRSGLYQVPQDKDNTGVLVDVEETFASDARVVHQKGSISGGFTFSPLDSGEHRICLTPKSFYRKKWGERDILRLVESKFENARLTIDFSIGDTSHFHSEESLNVEALTSHLNMLVDKLTDIKREQSFIRAKEATFRDLLEKTCENVVVWLLAQIVVFFGACLVQLRLLLRFFMKRKSHID